MKADPQLAVDMLAEKVIACRKATGQDPEAVLLTPAEADDLMRWTGVEARKPWAQMWRLGLDVGYEAKLPIAKDLGGYAKVKVLVNKDLVIDRPLLDTQNLYNTIIRLATEMAAVPSLKKLCESARDCGGGSDEYDDVKDVIDALEVLAQRLDK